MASPSNRGGPTFFTSFLSAFRSTPKYYATPTKPSAQANPSAGTPTSATTAPRNISSKASPNWDSSPTSDASSFENLRSASSLVPRHAHNTPTTTTAATQAVSQPSAPLPLPLPRSPTPNATGFQRSRAPSAHRRGSDSSNEGVRAFKDAVGAQNWYIGGRTATGEEKYYKLGMVKRYNSQDRLSLDRLSL